MIQKWIKPSKSSKGLLIFFTWGKTPKNNFSCYDFGDKIFNHSKVGSFYHIGIGIGRYKKSYRFLYRYQPIRKMLLSVFIGIGISIINLIGRTLTYGLKLSIEAWILKFLKKSFNNLRFNELQLHFGNSNFFCKA